MTSTENQLDIADVLMFAGAIAYFVLPADLIPDFLPFGFSDDMAALTVAFKSGQKLFTSVAVDKANNKALELLGKNFNPELAARMSKEIMDAKSR